jgi:hypothetical protein
VPDPFQHEIRSDESGAAGYQYRFFIHVSSTAALARS